MYDLIEGKREFVGTVMYLNLLADILIHINRVDILELDTLAKSFCGVAREISDGTLEVVQLDD